MLYKYINKYFKQSLLTKCLIASALLIWLAAIPAAGQTQDTATASLQPKAKVTQTVLMPILQEYKGIKIGMTQDEVREKLGKPETESGNGYFYNFSDEESAQVGFDADKKVRLVAVFYTAGNKNAPKYTDVFGQDAAIEKQENGNIYNLIRYPDAGYWVSYSRLAGDDGMVTVMMQKL